MDSLQNIVSLQSTDHNKCLPKFLVCHLRQTVTGLARIPFVNSYVRIPPIVWKFGWQPTMEGAYHSELPPLPVDILKEKDVLKEFVYRVNQVGKSSCSILFINVTFYMVVLVIFVKHHKQVFCREKFPISRKISFLISFFYAEYCVWVLRRLQHSYEQFSNL